MTTISTIAELRNALSAYRLNSQTIGFVPTMGALHEGHLSLVRSSKKRTDITVVSIFVNPTQFGPNEDFSKYPRTLETDSAQLEAEEADILFTPSAEEMYPKNAATTIDVGPITTIFEGEIRPGHFKGVASVVASLFHIVQPDIAFFGQKDLQQVAVIRQMVRDLHFPLTLSVEATIREAHGLAMSSRNRYLSDAEREHSLVLYKTLMSVKECMKVGASISDCILAGKQFFKESAGTASLDYLAIVEPETFQIPESFKYSCEYGVIIAARLGMTRLIDNILVTL